MNKTRLGRSNPQKQRYWQKVVLDQQGSGQSVRDYCCEVGVKEWAFYWWRRKLSRRGPKRSVRRQQSETVVPRETRGSSSDRKFLPIHVLADQAAAGVEIHLRDGRMVRVGPGVTRRTLVEVLAALEVRPC